jgi:hypothetical protein
MIPSLVRDIIRGLSKAADLGFDKAVIATDHGFLLFHEQKAGDVAARPPGNWLIQKARCVLGKGEADSANLVMKGDELGIPGEFDDYGAPKALVAYMRGQLYCHEGLSLQECILPCLSVRLEPTEKKTRKRTSVNLMLTYRQGKSDTITSRRPVVDLAWPQLQSGFFDDDREIEVIVEAIGDNGAIVGWAGSSPTINLATGCVRIKPGAAFGVGLRMEEEFSGKFTVRVLDASTNIQLASLNLKTGYFE